MLVWAEKSSSWNAADGPFVAKVTPKGDGRWNWAVVADGADNPTATGVAASRGAAQTACEQFVKRSGRV